MEKKYPILEFDSAEAALIEPRRVIKPIDVPEHAVACFFQDVLSTLTQHHNARIIKHLRSEIGRHPVYEVEIDGKRLVVFHPGVGAPLAVAFLEEVIALGCRKFMACGGVGVLESSIAMGHAIVPTAAIREEGTSYHYLPHGREVSADPQGVAALTLSTSVERATRRKLVARKPSGSLGQRQTPGRKKIALGVHE